YALDRDGKPIFDLRPEEVVLDIHGEVLPIDTLDRYRFAAAEPPASAAKAVERESSAPPRQVFLLVDLAFASRPGLTSTRQLALQLVARLAPADRLTLLTFTPAAGLREEMGPLSPAERPRIKKALEKLRATAQLELDPLGDVAPVEEMEDAFDRVRANSAEQYRAVGAALATGLQTLSVRLAALPGPKLLVYLSEGLNDSLYIEGNRGHGSAAAATSYSSGLLATFAPALKALAEAGTVPVFVNALGSEAGGDAFLRHVSQETGGTYLQGTDRRQLLEELDAATSAYYEAGVYSSSLPADTAAGAVKLVIRRPGARAVSPARFALPTSQPAPDRRRRDAWVVDLVARGKLGGSTSPGDASALSMLPGGASAKGRLLSFRPDWQAAPLAARVELYQVLISVASHSAPELLKLDHQELPRDQLAPNYDIELPPKRALIWGLVVIDRESKKTWLRRLLLEAPKTPPGAAKG
nr:hypothetical protein [Thermoanaerobaculia bacterium]